MRAAIDRRIPARLLADPDAVRAPPRSRCSRPRNACRCSCGWSRPTSAALRRPLRPCARCRAAACSRRRDRRRQDRSGAGRCGGRDRALAGKRCRELSRGAAWTCLCSLDQHGRLPQLGITVDAVIGLDVVGFLVAGLALLIVRLAVGLARASQAAMTAVAPAPSAPTPTSRRKSRRPTVALLCFVFHRMSSL